MHSEIDLDVEFTEQSSRDSYDCVPVKLIELLKSVILMYTVACFSCF